MVSPPLLSSPGLALISSRSLPAVRQYRDCSDDANISAVESAETTGKIRKQGKSGNAPIRNTQWAPVHYCHHLALSLSVVDRCPPFDNTGTAAMTPISAR